MAASTPLIHSSKGYSIRRWEYWGSGKEPRTDKIDIYSPGSSPTHSFNAAIIGYEQALNQALDKFSELVGDKCEHRHLWRDGCSLCHNFSVEFLLEQEARRMAKR